MAMKKFRNILLGCLLALVMLPSACEEDFADPNFGDREEYMLIYDYLKTREDLSIYKELCDYTGFYSYISTAGYYSVYAPTDSAWQVYFKQKGISDFKEKPAEYWMQFMKYQAIEHKAKLNSNAYNAGRMDDPTLLDRNYYLTMDVTSYAAVKINNSAVIKEYNINLQNGYLQIIDAVLEPPIYSVYEVLKESGRYEYMLNLFEQNGMKGWLTDSLLTIFIEPDPIIKQYEEVIEDFTPEEKKKWLEYHIFPGERYFSSVLDNEMLPTLTGDLVTFNMKTGLYYWNQKANLSRNLDKNALNGVIHEMGSLVEYSSHTPGIVKFNLYGGTNPAKGYEQNVFADFPAMVMENMNYASWHRRVRNIPKPPICEFHPSQKNEAFTVEIPDVLPAVYTVRLVYRDETKPHVTAYYGSMSLGKVDLADKLLERFEEYDRMKMHTWKTKIQVKEAGKVTLKFQVEEFSLLFMERVDLIPDVKF